MLSTVAESLEEKKSAIIGILETDADSFAKRAQMYYETRPRLIKMLHDFHHAYRPLAHRSDRLHSVDTICTNSDHDGCCSEICNSEGGDGSRELLMDEVERLRLECRNQKLDLMQKDEEKREVIRQLSLAVQVMKEQNVGLEKRKRRNTGNGSSKVFKWKLWRKIRAIYE